MKLTPLEIRKQEFRKAMRGFDPIEVQTFLDMVAEQYEQLLEENNALNRRVIEMETKLRDYQENERTLRETLLNVQEVKKQSEESSRRQADLMLKEAELKALEILENARKQARQIREEVNWLKSQKESFINRLRHILVSQIELLSVMEIDDVVPEEMKQVLQKSKSAKLSTPKLEHEEQASAGDYLVVDRETQEDKSKEQTVSLPKHSEQNPGDPAGKNADESSSDPHNAGNTAQLPSSQANSSGEEDINEFFKKGIQIDDLIKNINKKQQEK